jgi:hypothetical protein
MDLDDDGLSRYDRGHTLRNSKRADMRLIV